jgi:hypothetical protein
MGRANSPLNAFAIIALLFAIACLISWPRHGAASAEWMWRWLVLSVLCFIGGMLHRKL